MASDLDNLLYLHNVQFFWYSMIFTFLPTAVIAQEYPGCFIIEPSGSVSSLNTLCQRNEPQNFKTKMNAQAFYKQGFSRALSRMYQEAVADFTEAIIFNPKFAEAYIARGHARNGIGDKKGQIQDFQTAIDIYRARGEFQRADLLSKRIRSIVEEIQMEEQEELKANE